MDRNVLCVIIGALIVVVVALGYYTYKREAKQDLKPSGVEMKLNENGLSVEQH